MLDVLAHLKSTKKEVPTLFYELARLCLTFRNNPKMETTALMLLNSLMEDKDKSSINFKCVSIALLKRCTFSGAEVARLLEPHSTLLLDIIENETDLSLRMLAAEVLPKITSTQGLPRVLNQMKSRILTLSSSEDDRLISKVLSNNLLFLLSQKSSNDTMRLRDSIELLLLIREEIDHQHLYSLLNLVSQNASLQELSIQVVLEGLPRGHAMPGFVLVAWYLMGEFGQSVFHAQAAHFPEFLKLINKASKANKFLRLVIISALAKLWVRVDHAAAAPSPHFESFKKAASRLFQHFTVHQDLETQTRASQFLFILQCSELTSAEKLEIFGNMPCKIPSQQFDQDKMLAQEAPQTSLPSQDILGLDFGESPAPSRPVPVDTSDPLDFFSTPVEPSKPKEQVKHTDPGLDLFMNSPMKVKPSEQQTPATRVNPDPLGLDLFGANEVQQAPGPVGEQKASAKKFDDMDLLSLGVEENKPPVSQAKNSNKNDEFDLEFL